jgi:hypothetical protein
LAIVSYTHGRIPTANLKTLLKSTLIWGSMLLAGAAQANLVANGGFEDNTATCTLPIVSWSGVGAFADGPGGCVGYAAHTGTTATFFGAVRTLLGISQDLSTTAGQSYHLQFFLASDGFTPNQFVVLWDGVEIFNQSNIAASGYVQYDFDLVAADATTTLSFLGRNDPRYLTLDDVSVVANRTVPEPGALALAALALLGAGVAARRGK